MGPTLASHLRSGVSVCLSARTVGTSVRIRQEAEFLTILKGKSEIEFLDVFYSVPLHVSDIGYLSSDLVRHFRNSEPI